MENEELNYTDFAIFQFFHYYCLNYWVTNHKSQISNGEHHKL